MKKVILSAIAMSLMFPCFSGRAQDELVDDFLSIEGTALPEIKEAESIPLDPKAQEILNWDNETKKALVSLPAPNRGQKYSLINWSTQDPEDWLSIDNWLTERDSKDTSEDWELRLRQEEHRELIGKVLQCIGLCEVYRGIHPANIQHLSRIYEGDEIRIGKDSLAWIFLIDGSLARLAPETSISFNEINLSKTEFFFEARLNEGHIFWSPRNKKEHPVELAPETDSKAIPLLVRESNQAYFERKIYHSQNDQARLQEIMVLDENAINDQFKALNKLKMENNSSINISTRLMVVAPNSSVVSKNSSFDFVFIPGGKSFIKRRTAEEGEELDLYLRGYSETEKKTITDVKWVEVEANGRSFSSEFEVPGHLQVIELITKRIKTIELAREIWTKEFTLPILSHLELPALLAREHGYTLWGEELQKRFDFLVEYTRRIETTNLRTIENLLVKIEGSGASVQREIGDSYYRESLKHYLLGLKTRYDKKNMKVREMTDLQYYVWILTHGKF